MNGYNADFPSLRGAFECVYVRWIDRDGQPGDNSVRYEKCELSKEEVK